MIKKLISAVAATAIAMTAFASLAFAEKTYDIRLDTGVTQSTGVGSGNRQYFTVKCDDLAGEYTSGLQVQIKVISGELDSFTMVKGTDKKGGLYIVEEGEDEETGDPIEVNSYLAASGWTKNLTTDAEGNQWIKFSWSSATPYISNGGIIAELYVVAKDTTADVEFELGGETELTTCTANNSNKVTYKFTPEVAPQYVLAAGTSTITEKSNGGSVTATQQGSTFTDAADAQAVAYVAELDSSASEKTGRWYATIGGTAMKTVNTFTLPNISAEKVKLGLIYKGAETVSNVAFKWE